MWNAYQPKTEGEWGMIDGQKRLVWKGEAPKLPT